MKRLGKTDSKRYSLNCIKSIVALQHSFTNRLGYLDQLRSGMYINDEERLHLEDILVIEFRSFLKKDINTILDVEWWRWKSDAYLAEPFGLEEVQKLVS